MPLPRKLLPLQRRMIRGRFVIETLPSYRGIARESSCSSSLMIINGSQRNWRLGTTKTGSCWRRSISSIKSFECSRIWGNNCTHNIKSWRYVEMPPLLTNGHPWGWWADDLHSGVKPILQSITQDIWTSLSLHGDHNVRVSWNRSWGWRDCFDAALSTQGQVNGELWRLFQ